MAEDAVTGNPLDSLAGVYTLFQEGVSTVSGKFEESATIILAACILIVLVKSWIENGTESDLISWVQDVIYMCILGTILLMGIQQHEQIAGWAWGLQGNLMEIMNTQGDIPNDGTGRGVINYLYRNTLDTVLAVWHLAIAGGSPPEVCTGGSTNPVIIATCAVKETFKTLVADVFSSFIFILILVMLLVYFLIMLLQIFTGWFMIGVGLAFLPICLAFYPIIESWAKNAIGLIASGIAHMGMVAFMLSITTTIIKGLTNEFAGGKYSFWAGAQLFSGKGPGLGPEIIGAILSKSFILLILCVVIVVMAISTAKAIGFATQIFGTISGMVSAKKASKTTAGGGGGGGGGDSKGATGGAADAATTAAKGSAKVAGAVADAGAAASTGGASLLVTGAKQAVKVGAEVAKKGAKTMANQMKDNRR